jgi:hypothetical protein
VLSFCVPLHAFGFQVAFTAVVFPCLLIAYMGQAAFLMKNPLVVERIFYDSVPGKVYLLARILNVFCIQFLSLNFGMQCRGFILASICDCYTCSYDCQPSYDICNILLHKAGHGSWLLP